jgi:hypothetical protein
MSYDPPCGAGGQVTKTQVRKPNLGHPPRLSASMEIVQAMRFARPTN